MGLGLMVLQPETRNVEFTQGVAGIRVPLGVENGDALSGAVSGESLKTSPCSCNMGCKHKRCGFGAAQPESG